MSGKIVAIVGPTAAGKTALALELAQQFPGEIVCADSRTIYRDMDIGTAKPTPAEQKAIRHHLLDIADPGELLSAAAFKQLATAAIEDIWSRGLVAYVVGGSGLYIDALLFNYQFPAAADPQERARLEAMTTGELQELLAASDPEAFDQIDLANRRRLIRAIETAGQPRSRAFELRRDTLLLGLSMNKEVAQVRITKRIKKMLDEGFLSEVQRIGEKYGWDSSSLEVIGYKAFKDVAGGTKDLSAAIAEFVRGDMALYKKQVTWFKRNPYIEWLDDPAAARPLVAAFLAT